MALIKCPECGAENVSESAIACPHCGYNLSAHKRKENLTEKSTQLKKSIIIIIAVLLIGVAIISGKDSREKEQYREFSGEYLVRAGLDAPGLPNVIHFDEDGTGHYYVDVHMYIFDYTLTSTTVKIDTHEEFMPIYKAELDVLCTRTADGFLMGEIKVEKRD